MYLHPAYVFHAEEELNKDTDLTEVYEWMNALKRVNLLDSDSDKCHVVLNCPISKAQASFLPLKYQTLIISSCLLARGLDTVKCSTPV